MKLVILRGGIGCFYKLVQLTSKTAFATRRGGYRGGRRGMGDGGLED